MPPLPFQNMSEIDTFKTTGIIRENFSLLAATVTADDLIDCLPYLISLGGEYYIGTAYLQLPLILVVTERTLNCEDA